MRKIILSIALALSLSANAYDIEINGIYYNIDSSSQTAEVTSLPFENPYVGDIVIPETVVYEGVEYIVSSIDQLAFAYSVDLLSVSIGDNVKEIGNLSFSACINLESISFGSKVEIIGESAFSGCTSLTSILLPSSIKQINDLAFSSCTKLTSVSLPDGLQNIGKYAFSYCTLLKSISFPNSVSYIGDGAFMACESLSILIIPIGLTQIEEGAFGGCTNLKTVYLPNSITSICKLGFYGLGLIYGGDFYCYASEVPSLGDTAFYVPSYKHKGTLHVPAGSIDDYRNAEQWKDFGNIVAITDEEQYPTAIIHIKSDDYLQKNPTIYSLNGQQLPKPQKGINIINGRKVVVK